MLIGAGALVATALRRAVRRARHGLPTLLAFGAFCAAHRPLHHLVGRARPVVAGGQPDARLPRRARRRDRPRAALDAAAGAAVIGAIGAFAVALSAWALLGKVFPRHARPGGAVRPPAGALRLLERDRRGRGDGAAAAGMGRRPARRAAAGAGRSRCPAIGILLTTLVLAYSRSALLAAVCGSALWFALVPLRLRGAATLALGALAGAGADAVRPAHPRAHPRPGRAGRAGRRRRWVRDRARAGAASCSPASASPARSPPTDPPSRESRRRQIGTVLLACLALVPVGALGAAAGLLPRAHRPDLARLELADRHQRRGRQTPPAGSCSSATPGRSTGARGSARRAPPAGRRRAPAASPSRAPGTRPIAGSSPTPTASSIETFADLGALGLLVSLGLLLVLGRGGAAHVRARPARPPRLGLRSDARRDRARRTADAAVRRRHLRRALEHRLDLGDPGHGDPGAAVRRLARRTPAARPRCARAARAERAPGARPRRAARRHAARRLGDLAAAARRPTRWRRRERAGGRPRRRRR